MGQEMMNIISGHAACGDGTAANPAVAVSISLGFQPRYVKVVTVDATTGSFSTEWIYGMAAAKGMQLKDDTTFKLTELAANGITVNSRGFTIGTACQLAAHKYHWVAFA